MDWPPDSMIVQRLHRKPYTLIAIQRLFWRFGIVYGFLVLFMREVIVPLLEKRAEQDLKLRVETLLGLRKSIVSIRSRPESVEGQWLKFNSLLALLAHRLKSWNTQCQPGPGLVSCREKLRELNSRLEIKDSRTHEERYQSIIRSLREIKGRYVRG